jgi:mono/diheme cytochrome c family protein
MRETGAHVSLRLGFLLCHERIRYTGNGGSWMNRAKLLIAPLAVLAGMIAVLAPAWAADAAAGAQLYAGKCQGCHCKAGEGNPAMAKELKVEMKPLGSPDVQKRAMANLK